MKVVFITGATGAVGSRLVAELIGQPDTQLKLLVRGESDDAAERRIARLLDYWGVGESQSADQVEVIRGDIVDDDLGMLEHKYAELARTVTHIIHAAADINLSLPLDLARKISLGGTQNVVRLARACQQTSQFRGLTFLSTVEVVGDYEGIVREEFLTRYQRNFLNSYEQTKSETEEYLREEGEQGLAVTIYRASMVVGDSKTGKSTRFGSFYYLLSDMLISPRAPLMPASDRFYIDTVPVDFVAEAIARLYDDESAFGKVYHATAGLADPLTVPDFCVRATRALKAQLQLELRVPTFISPRLCRNLLRAVRPLSVGKMRKSIDRQLIFLDFFLVRWQLDNTEMVKVMQARGVHLPHLLEYLPTLCRYYLDQRVGRGGIPRELA